MSTAVLLDGTATLSYVRTLVDLFKRFLVDWVGATTHATYLRDYLSSWEDGTLALIVPEVISGRGHSPCL